MDLLKPTRRGIIASAIVAKPALAQIFRFRGAPPPSAGPPPTTQAFITGQTFNSTGGGNYRTNYEGFATTPVTNLAVSGLARWIQSGNNLSHTLAIFDGPSSNQIASVSISPPYSTVGYLYATVSPAVILQAGRQYYIVSQEYQFSPVDILYQPDATLTHTADASLDGAVWQNADSRQWNFPGGSSYGPVNFQYTTTTAMASLSGSRFYPNPGAQSFGPGNLFPASVVQVATGTITLDCNYYRQATEDTPAYSVVAQWMIDNQPVGPYLLGPANPSNGSLSQFPLTLDTTTLADGTHSVWLRVIDTRSPGTDTNFGAYISKSTAGSLIVQNTGPKNGAQTVPIHSSYPANTNRLLRPPSDFVSYPGDTTRSVNVFAYPAPFAPPAYSTASPFNPGYSGTVLDPRVRDNYYVEDTTKLRCLEYEGDTNFEGLPATGGVFATCGTTEGGNYTTTTDTAWSRVFSGCMWDGGRYDTRVTAYCALVADPDDTVATPTGFIGAEASGRIVKLPYDGSVTTLWGLKLNRASFLPLDYQAVNSLGANGYTLPNIAARHTLVGTIGTPSFGQIGGTNCSIGGLQDVAYDPRDSTNNTIYTVNLVTHIVIKITGLKSGSPVATRFAGVEGSPGLVNGNVSGGNPGNAKFASPTSCIMDGSGNLYIADRDNCAIRKIDASGNVTTLCGNQTGRPPPVVPGTPATPPSAITTYDESVLSKPQPGNTYGWSPSYAAFNGYISGTTLTVVGTPTGSSQGIQIGLPLNGAGVAANTFITAGSGSSWTVNNSQTVGSSGSPVALQAGLIPTGSAYVVFPQALRFVSSGDIVFLEWGCTAVRRIILSGANSGNVIRVNIPESAYAANSLDAFTWFDVDNPVYPVDYRGSSPTAGQGACGALDDIILIGFPEGSGNSTSARLSLDGSYDSAFSFDGGSFVGGSFWIYPGDVTVMPCAVHEGLENNVSDAFGVYTWIAAFSKRQARLATAGFRYLGLLNWRVPLPTDPALSTLDKAHFGLGMDLHRLGSPYCFPWGIKPGLDLIHGRNGFGHLGSDVGPTHHDLCVVYNGGDAQWHTTNTNYAISSMTWNSTGGGQIVVVMAVATFVEQVGNFVFISGATNSGSLGNSAVNGKFKLVAFTDSQHWTVAAPASAGQIGTIGGSPQIMTGTGILAKYIATGGHSTFPRPEFDTPTGVHWDQNRDAVALIYYIMRNTTAGGFPTPTPNPTLNTSNFAIPQISNISATRLSLTSIQVTWNTDQQSIGTAIAGSADQQGQTYIYNSWSPMEAGYGTTHSAVISQLPMTTPTHWSIQVKDGYGNTSYIPDQTIGIHPDGTFITGGTGAVPNNTTKLVTNYGEWTFGAHMDAQPGYGGGAFFQVLLNGKNCHPNAFNTLTPQPNVSMAQQLQVNNGGNLYALTKDQLWYVWDGYAFSSQTNTVAPPPSGHNPPAAINQPFGPITADGTSITSTSGSLVTADGVWTIDGASHANLNGIPLRDDNGNTSFTVTQLQVNAHGQMFLKTSDGNWHLWANYQLNVGTTNTPPSGPVPVSMSFSPTDAPTSGVTHTAATGTLVTTVSVKMSDGSVFSGTLAVTQDQNSNTVLQVSGAQLQVLQPGWNSSTGIGSLVTVTATQNGFVMEGLFNAFHS